MTRKATIACLAGAGTAPELMAEAVLALDAVARMHGVELEEQHVPFGGVALARFGQAMPVSTRAAALDADAVLVAGAEEPTLADVMGELDLRARVTRVRFGHDGDVAVVAPLDEISPEWSIAAAFRIAESRALRLAVVGDAGWNELAEALSDSHPDVHVEFVSPKLAIPLAAFTAARFDVVAAAPAWAEAVVEIVAASASARVAAHALLAEHGPSLFIPSPDGGFALAGHGIVNPSSMLLASALLLEYGLDEPGAAATLAGAVSAALVDGPQTPDLLRRGVGATSREFTTSVLSGFQLSWRNAEFWTGAA
jgi:3-isopropylmalate dehydrogenase